VLALQMTDGGVAARVAAMFGRKPGRRQPRDARWQTTYSARVTGAKAVAWMTALWPLMGRRRQMQIDRAVASYDPGRLRCSPTAALRRRCECWGPEAVCRAVAAESAPASGASTT
jgi:hypothetical protein